MFPNNQGGFVSKPSRALLPNNQGLCFQTIKGFVTKQSRALFPNNQRLCFQTIKGFFTKQSRALLPNRTAAIQRAWYDGNVCKFGKFLKLSRLETPNCAHAELFELFELS
jgi:hypothetical protein